MFAGMSWKSECLSKKPNGLGKNVLLNVVKDKKSTLFELEVNRAPVFENDAPSPSIRKSRNYVPQLGRNVAPLYQLLKCCG